MVLLLRHTTSTTSDRYTVEWEEISAKKKSQQHRHMYGTTTKARIKPENLALWGTVPRPSAEEVAAAVAAASHKKSRKDRKQAAKAKQQDARREQQEQQEARREQQEQQEAKEQQQEQEHKAHESSMDQFERISKEVMGGGGEQQQQPPPKPQPQPPKMIQIKVKCPLDKKPGDSMVFANPHIPGTKEMARIPPDTVPGKFFKVMVPLPVVEQKRTPSCCVCAKPLLLDGNDNNSVPLRTCIHVACTTCHPTLQGKACTICASPIPTLNSLHPLPYLQPLDNPVVKDALLEEFYISREAIRDSSKQGELDQAAETTVKAIDKHYRRASIKVHPDRHGETFRSEFDALTKARDVLRDDVLRRSYIAEMLEIVCKVNVGYIVQSHQIWVSRNDPDSQDQSRPSNNNNKYGKRETATTMQLDGGLRFSRLKKPRVVVVDDKKRQVRIYLPIHDGHQFLEYCHGVTILASCGKYCRLQDDG
jgi:flagellar biosynthesis GTPase FlhF